MGTFLITPEWKFIFDELSDEQIGKMLRSVVEYLDTGIFPAEEKVLRVAFAAVKNKLDNDVAKRKHISMVRSEAGRKGGLKSKRNRKKKKQIRTESHEVFEPPLLSEVESYITNKGLSVNAERFYHFYEARDWMTGENKMKSWKSAVAYWNTNEKKKALQTTAKPSDYKKGFKTATI